MVRLIVKALFLLSISSTVVAQTPSGVHISLPGDGGTSVQSSAYSGTLSSRGITVTWDVQSNSATATFVGTFATESSTPEFVVYWLDTPAGFPMSVGVTSATDTAYDFQAPYRTGSWNYDHDQFDLVGDYYFGTYFPACLQVDVQLAPTIEGSAYDISVVMNWGQGVSVAEESWGAIKALYR